VYAFEGCNFIRCRALPYGGQIQSARLNNPGAIAKGMQGWHVLSFRSSP